MPIIALFAKTYSFAESIAEKVGDKLGYSVIDQEIKKIAAHEYNITAHHIDRVMAGSKGLLNIVTHEWEKNFVHVRAALAELLSKDKMIFLGPEAYLVPQPITHVLRVEIITEEEVRIEEAMKQEKLQREDARALINKNDQELERWVDQIADRVAWDPFFLDMRIEIPGVSISEAVDIISQNVNKETFKPVAISQQTVKDHQLAASMSESLLEKGIIDCEVIVENQKATVLIYRKSTPKGALSRSLQSLHDDSIEQAVQEICSPIKEIKEIEVRPSLGFQYGEKGHVQVEQGRKTSVPEVQGKTDRKGEQPIRVLVVDDDEELLDYFTKRLRTRGLQVEGITRGIQAIELAREKTFDVAVVDLKMPGIDGIETLRNLKQVQPMLQVMIYTGCGTLEAAFESGRLDAVAFHSKPHKFEDLLEEIKNAARRKARLQYAAFQREIC